MQPDKLSVSFLTQYFYPEVPGTAQIATDLAIGLKESGFEVAVYTGQPAYVEGRRLPSPDSYKGVEVHRAYSRRLSRNGSGSRLLNGATVAAMTLLRLLRRRKPDLLLVDSTSPFLVGVAWLMRVLRRVPYVFIVHDVYPEIAIQLGVISRGALAARLWRFSYRRVYEGASRIVVLGERMRGVVRRSLRKESWDRCTIIPNWADGETIVPLGREDNPLRRELGLTDKLVVLYSGNMGLTHDMETVVEAAERLRDMDGLRFLFIGQGGRREAVASEVLAKGLENVVMLPYQPADMLPLSLTCGDISVVTLEKGMEGLSVPSKVYSSLAAGLAIVAVMGPESEIGDIIEEHRCGYRVTQGDVEGVVRAISALHDDPDLLKEMGKRARACFEERYTREMGVGRYVSILRAVATGSRRGTDAAEEMA